MDGQPAGDKPGPHSQNESIPQAPSKTAIAETEITKDSNTKTETDKGPTRELRREFRWFEIASLSVNAMLAFVGIGALCIYSGQLQVMRGTLAEMKRSGGTSADQLWQAIGNMNWMARTADGSLHQSQQAMDDSRRLLGGQLSTMQKQFEALDRPWVSISVSPIKPLLYDGKTGVNATFIFSPTNVGRSPAQEVQIEPRLIIGSMGTNVTGIQQRMCRQMEKGQGMPAYILFPGPGSPQEISLQLSVADINAFFTPFELNQGPIDPIPIILVGCVDYVFASSTRHHHTGFAFDVLMKDRLLVLKSKTPLPPESILLMLHPSGGYFAD